MLQTIAAVNQAVNNFIWGVPAMVCIIGVGLLLSVRTGFIQIRKFPYAIKTTIGRMFRKRDASDGAMTPFQAVCTALAATVGTGNIAGVAGAIAIGGPGAVFWMWCSALLGMCTKFAEVTLAVHYRERSETGEWVGGPMYYIKNGLSKHWQFLAVLYSLFGVLTVFGTGNATQVNTIVAAIDTALLDRLFGVGAGVGDGAGAEAGLIGEDAAGNALLHTEEDAADGTAGEGLWVKCTADDGGQHRREAPVVDDHDAQCQHDVEQCHKRHQLLGHAADALDAAQQHHSHHHGHHHAHDEVDRGQDAVQAAAVGQQGRVDGCDDGVDLGGVAGAEDRQHTEQRVQHREELPPAAEAVFNIVHGAAHQLAVFVPLAEMHSQRHFGELGTHAQQSRAPHPEHRTRPCLLYTSPSPRDRG